jgi:dihydroneopterin aldolase
MDKIGLTGMIFFGKHGATKEEKQVEQEFIVDIEIEKPLDQAGRTDNLSSTIDYSEVYFVTQNVVENTSFNLIETIASTIAENLISKFSFDKVIIKVTKSKAPMGENSQNAWVQIIRENGK